MLNYEQWARFPSFTLLLPIMERKNIVTTSGRAKVTITKHGGYLTKNEGLFLRQTEPCPYRSITRQISVHDSYYQIVGFLGNKTILIVLRMSWQTLSTIPAGDRDYGKRQELN